jgi:hypothetical protein
MSLGLLCLAIVSSLFAAAVAGRWGQAISERLASLHRRLSAERTDTRDQLAALEQAVDDLPLELILPAERQARPGPDFEEAGLLFIHLVSLARYVETLDEQSLLNYTESLQELFERVASLYGGQLSVGREFGILMTFAGSNAAGSPGFRALCAASLLGRLSAAIGTRRPLQYQLSLACGLGEAARHPGTGASSGSLYPGLYNQHIIDELAILAGRQSGAVMLAAELAEQDEVRHRCRVEKDATGYRLDAFEEPHSDLLERQYQRLGQELLGR